MISGDRSTRKIKTGVTLLSLFYLLLISIVPEVIAGTRQMHPVQKADWVSHFTAPVYSSPVVDDNRIYIGGNDSLLHVLELNTGRELWTFRTNGEIRSAVCVDGQKLVLNGGDGNLYAMDSADGRLIWTFKTGGERKYDFADYFHSTPLVRAGVVYFGSGDSNFYAVSLSDGKLLWKYPTGDVVHSTGTVSGDRIFFGSFDGYVYGLNINSGSLIWKFKTVGHRYFPKGEVQGSPFVYRNMLFVGARDYNVYALDQEKGFSHWNKAFPSGWGLCNQVHDSVLYIATADERKLIAADPETGREYWNRDMEFLVFGNGAFSDSLMVVGTTIGKLHGIDLKTARTVWTFHTETYESSRQNYFKPDDSYRDDIYSIIKSNEQFLEVEEELGGIFSSPAIVGTRIIFSSTNGNIYCLKKK